MLIYPDDSRCCTKCGRAGTTTSQCPRCVGCKYCREKGHSKFDCPKAPRCIHCRKKGHSSDTCFQKPSSTSRTLNARRGARRGARGGRLSSQQPEISAGALESLPDTEVDSQESTCSDDEFPEAERRFRKWKSLSKTIHCPKVLGLPKGSEVGLQNHLATAAALPDLLCFIRQGLKRK